MTITAALLIYALVTALLAPALIGRASWLSRSPRLGVLAWQAALAAVLGALVLLIAAAAVPVDGLSLDLKHLLHACAVGFSESFRAGPTGVVRLVAGVVGAVIACRLTWVLAVQLIDMRRRRDQQRTLLGLLAFRADSDEALRLPAAEPAAYCVPGDGGRIVLTTGAAERLDDAQRSAVIAHEKAHLRERHDLVLLGSGVAAASFSRLSFFRQAHRRVSLYLEMLADDVASAVCGRAPVAAALVRLDRPVDPTHAPRPASSSSERIARLLDRSVRDPNRLCRAAFVTALLGLAVGPWLLTAAPVWAAYSGLCPTG